MIRFLLGEAGTGKTTLLYQRLREALDAGKKAILLVPEQASFEAEKLAYETLGAQRCLSLEVLSFTRLANLVFREYGGLAGRALDDCGRVLLMSLALGEVQDTLEIYGRNPGNGAFVSAMVGMAAEFKNAGVSPQMLEKTVETLPTGQERDKLRELSVVYSAYQALVERNYVDQLDDLMRACHLTDGTDFFSRRLVFCDGFKGFMAGEFRMLERIIAQSPEVTFAFTCDGLHDGENGMGVFSPVKETLRRLMRMAASAGVPVASPVVLTQPHRFHAESLRYMAARLFRRPERYAGEPDGAVCAARFQNPYDEIEGVARQIAALVRRGYRYRDIAVIARSLEEYRTAVESVFRRYEIPWFMDERVDVETHPITSLVLTALEAVKGAPDTGKLLRLAKSPLLGIDACDAALLENYCYVWRVEKQQWEAPFQNHPDGFGVVMDQETEDRLARIEGTRQKLMAPLASLRAALEDGSGGVFARGVFRYLEESGAAEALAAAPASDDVTPQVWDGLCQILDRFYLVMEQVRLPAARLTELLRLSLQTLEVGLIPQTADQVLVGEADRVRPNAPAAVFVIGANLGVFPARIENGGLLSDEDRRLLAQKGLEISETLEERAVSEKYWAYFAMTSPSDFLYVSWCAADLSGKARYPSALVEQLRRMFPACERAGTFSDGGMLDSLVNDAAVFSECCRRMADPAWEQDAAGVTLAAYLEQTRYAGRLEGVQRLREEPGYSLSPSQAARLFGKTLYLSPTRADDFALCPFKYFLRYALRLRPRRRAELTPLESGTALHYVLSEMLRLYSPAELRQLSREQLLGQVDGLLQKHMEQSLDRRDEAPARFSYLYKRMRTTLMFLLEHMGAELGQSRFVPVAFELPIGWGGTENGQTPAPPMTITARDGVKVILGGIVDRVDSYEQDGKRYLRVIDYKSGQKKFDLSALLYGLDTQMPVYLFTLCRGGEEDPIPAGILYMPAKAEAVEAGRDTQPDKIQSDFQRRMRMDGLLLMDDQVLQAMEQELSGQFIPIKKTKDNRLDASSQSHIATPQELELIRRHIVKNAKTIAEQLRGGGIDNLPMSRPDRFACDYCEYAAVCGREQDSSKQRDCPNLSREEIFRLLEQEEE